MNFQQAISDAGGGIHHIIPDGKIHRITGADDKPGSKAWWYVMFGTGGAFGSWKLGLSEKWHQDGERSKEADAVLAKQIRQAQQQRQADTARKQKRAQETARYLWASGADTITHPYTAKKQITAYKSRQKNNRLLIPMYHQGQIWNIQQIQSDGTKRFLKGGRVSGCYMLIGLLSDRIYICEGYATGCSLHQNTGASVAVAFNAGNLKHVALAIREKHPEAEITIAADNDTRTEGNPGLTKGRQAAAAIGGDVIYPDFSDESFNGSDYNDYLTQGGAL